MSKQRKQYSAALKSKVALEAIKGVRSANEIATHYGVHPNQGSGRNKRSSICRKRSAMGAKRAERAETELQNELYQQIGQLRAYFAFYNDERLHAALGYRTPAAIYHQG